MTDDNTPTNDATPAVSDAESRADEAAPPAETNAEPESAPAPAEAVAEQKPAEEPVAESAAEAPPEPVSEQEPAAETDPVAEAGQSEAAPAETVAEAPELPAEPEEPAAPDATSEAPAPAEPEPAEPVAAADLAADSVAVDATATAPEAADEPKPKVKKPRKAKAAEPVAAETEGEPATEATDATAEAPAEAVPASNKRWYAVKVQSGREESIKAAIERKVKIENLEPFFGQIVIPVEEVNEKKKVRVKVKDKKTGEVETTTQERNVVKKHKKFPGYIFAEVEFNDEILYVFRETSGVGDFVGIPARRGQGGERLAPAPMTDAEVQSMLTGVPVPGGPSRGKAKTVVKLDYEKGDKVRIKNGAFAGHEAEVKSITEAKDPADSPKVTVIVTMWGRPVDVDLDYWEVDKA